MAKVNELACTFNEFKMLAREFMFEIKTMNIDELDNAWKCLSLAYLNMEEDMWQDSAAVLLKMMGVLYEKREAELGYE